VREDRPGRTVVELSGAAQFEVVHDPLRLFRVETHGLAVEVLGTRFFVAEQGPRVRVTVQQGRVRVLWASHYDELGAGQSALFLPEPAIASAAPPPPPPPLHEPGPGLASPGPTVMAPAEPVGPPRRMGFRPPRRVRPAPTGSAAPQPAGALGTPPAEPGPASWQTLAHEGQFEQAYRLAYGPTATHRAAEPPLLHERALAPGELLLLADVARLSHHPTDAVAPLSRLLREHAEDPRAPLAAFTLGRVLLDELGRPREAAQSFGQVQRLDPEGPLSQDALAREVEAWSRAGEAASARACAQQYLQKYPTGRRLRSVRHFGELW
jgi:transmembrane sensor